MAIFMLLVAVMHVNHTVQSCVTGDLNILVIIFLIYLFRSHGVCISDVLIVLIVINVEYSLQLQH